MTPRLLFIARVSLCVSCAAALPAVAAAAPAPKPQSSIYSYSLVKPGGALLALSDLRGKVVVIVNVASKSTFADQLPALTKLADQFKDEGLVILAVPSNDFGAEEPGDDAATQKYYADQHVSFSVMARSAVCGKDQLPVYAFLTAASQPKVKPTSDAAPSADVHWSFTKFIVTRDGQLGARFEPDVAPDSAEFRIAIDKALAGTLKLGGKPDRRPSDAGDDAEDDGGL